MESLRRFARRVGVTDKAVRKALAAGVFSPAAIVRAAEPHGWPVVVDVDRAIAEWTLSGRRVRTRVEPAEALALRLVQQLAAEFPAVAEWIARQESAR